MVCRDLEGDQLLVRTDGRKSKEIAVPVSLLDVQRRRYSSSDPKVILDNAKDNAIKYARETMILCTGAAGSRPNQSRQGLNIVITLQENVLWPSYSMDYTSSWQVAEGRVSLSIVHS